MLPKKPILEVPIDASEDEIRKLYKKAALKHHPDKGGDEDDFKQLHDEFELLIKESQEKSAPTVSASSNNNDSRLPSANSGHKEVKTIKEEKIVEVTKIKYRIKFSPFSSNEERVSAITDGLKNGFGSSKEPRNIFSGSKKIGQISFLGRFVEQVKTTIHKVIHGVNKPQASLKQAIEPAAVPEKPRLRM